ncbi:MAG: hypothetical protein LBN03_02280 [Bifidobacteriaceae bacterium]|jgi:histidinol-phosphatase|nr:hypothetical protein [Bifidobacteriaceae bacterium]
MGFFGKNKSSDQQEVVEIVLDSKADTDYELAPADDIINEKIDYDEKHSNLDYDEKLAEIFSDDSELELESFENEKGSKIPELIDSLVQDTLIETEHQEIIKNAIADDSIDAAAVVTDLGVEIKEISPNPQTNPLTLPTNSIPRGGNVKNSPLKIINASNLSKEEKKRMTFALNFLRHADKNTMEYFNIITTSLSSGKSAQSLYYSLKDDKTPVTIADINTENMFRSLVEKHFPDDIILGEEGGDEKANLDTVNLSDQIANEQYFKKQKAIFDKTFKKANSHIKNSDSATDEKLFQWIIDPIDGTANYVRGMPIWATLIALYDFTNPDDPKPIFSVVSAPAISKRWFGIHNAAAWTADIGQSLESRNTRNICISGETKLEDAFVSYSSLYGWNDLGLTNEFYELLNAAKRTRAFGDFYNYMLVAEGVCDIALEPELKTHDMAALIPILSGAGAVFSSVNPDHINPPFGPNLVATSSAALHSVVISILNQHSNDDTIITAPVPLPPKN